MEDRPAKRLAATVVTVDAWEGLLDEIQRMDWASYAMWPSTEWYVPSRVPKAFAALRRVHSHRGSRAAYQQFMDALAHNHEGWVYAAAAPGADLLARTARILEGWARITSLEVLIDLTCFAADASFRSPRGDLVRLATAIRDAAAPLRPDLERWRAARPDQVPAGPGWCSPEPDNHRAFRDVASSAAVLLETLQDNDEALLPEM
ncbi:MAG: hypothetical protein QG671_298 [Actinomycetota bacterium]|nr:hypothetical protein [Actinomycetota bacterium]